MNPAYRFQQLGHRQTTLAQGIDMLEQIQRELGQDRATADAWGLVTLLSQACAVPLNAIVNALPPSPAGAALDAFNDRLRAWASGAALAHGEVGDASLPWGFEMVRYYAQKELSKKGAAHLVPGAKILLGLAEDGWALFGIAQTVSAGQAEMRSLASQMQRRIDLARRQWLELGIERARLLDEALLMQRTA